MVQIEAQSTLECKKGKVSQVKVDSVWKNTGYSTMFKKNITLGTLNDLE